MRREDWDNRYSGTELLWTAEANRFLVAEASDLAPGKALDLACGEGRNAVWLAERGWTVRGVDYSGVALVKAAKLAEGRGVEPDWVHADLLEYVPEPGAYQLVVIFYLQIPADERRVVVRRAAGALAPGGELLIVAHDSSNLEHGWGGPQDPAVLYNADDVAEDLADTGVEIVRGGVVERPVDAPDGEKIALDLLVRARAAG